MEIADFLPVYPFLEDSNFYDSLFHKKEFNELQIKDKYDTERINGLEKYQVIITRFLSPYTPYKSLFLFHEMGSGKCVLPDTSININNTIIKISNLWDKYDKIDLLHFTDNEGMWIDISNENLLTPSMNTKLTFENNRINKIYKQKINELIYVITLSDNKTIGITRRHKLFTNLGWKNDIYDKNVSSVGIQGSTQNGKNVNGVGFVPIKNINLIKYEGYVYDLEIEKFHNFVGNGIICHNTFSAIKSIEYSFDHPYKKFNRAIIILKNKRLMKEFKYELVYKATDGKYIPDGVELLSPESSNIRISKLVNQRYDINTFEMFAKKVSIMSDIEIINTYSNCYIVLDEIQNIRPTKKQSKIGVDMNFTYYKLHNFLHVANNTKILLLSGTPMRDNPVELIDVFNLILPLEKQLFKADIINHDLLKQRLKGYVSYIKTPPSKAEKKIIYSKRSLELNMNNILIFTTEMSEFQSMIYVKTFMKEKHGVVNFDMNDPRIVNEMLNVIPDQDDLMEIDEEDADQEDEIISKKKPMGSEHYNDKDENISISKGFNLYKNLTQVSSFVFPDGTFGKEGFEKNIKLSSKYIDNGTRTVYSFKNNQTALEIKNNLKKYSTKFHSIIELAMQADKCCFIYFENVTGSGSILLGLILELYGFELYRGTSNISKEKPRYALLTGSTTFATETSTIIRNYNNHRNATGNYLKILIGSKVMNEGFSLNHTQVVSVVIPHWNYYKNITKVYIYIIYFNIYVDIKIIKFVINEIL